MLSGDARNTGWQPPLRPLGLHPPDHLVLHLNQIAGVEEIRFRKKRIGHLLGMGIQTSSLPQRFGLGIPCFAFGHETACKHNYAAMSIAIRRHTKRQ